MTTIVYTTKGLSIMHIKTVELNNYRGYENIKVEFQPGLNLVIGNNGAGKSSLLAGTRAILEELFESTGGLTKLTHFEKSDIRISSQKIGDTTYAYQRNYPMYVECELAYNDDVLNIRVGY